MLYKVVRRDLRNNFVEHHLLWKNFCYEENPYEPGPKKSQKATFYWTTLYKRVIFVCLYRRLGDLNPEC